MVCLTHSKGGVHIISSYYKPSGGISAAFLPLFLVFMAVGIPVLSFAYIYLVFYIPLVQASIVFTVFCGMALGYIIERVAKAGKVRNPALVFILTFIAACVMKYVQWCVYLPLVFSEAYGYAIPFTERLVQSCYYLIHPGDIYELALIVNEFGVWSIGSSSYSNSTVTGILLLIVWIAEFIIIAACALRQVKKQAKRPFSEEAQDWYAEVGEKVSADLPADIKTLVYSLKGGSLGDLPELIRMGATDSTDYLCLTFYQPPRDTAEPYYITVTRTSVQKGKKKNTTLIEYMAVDEQALKEIHDAVESYANASGAMSY